MNRGSGSELMNIQPSLFGFNEAPIHESGKCRFSTPRAFAAVRLQ